MSPVQASCPACGGPVQFKIGTSRVTVCEYCRSVIARGDQALEDLGKVADLTETGSPLEVWMPGRYQGVPFDLTGRAQTAHPMGGMWDEWYAAFAGGRWGWLAEAQGRFYMTFEQENVPPDAIPPFERLKLGQMLDLGSGAPLTVAEKSQGKAVAAEGEIPYRLVPGESFQFADLSGPSGVFATIDYGSDPPVVYLGREVSLADLGVAERKRNREREARQVEGLHLNCPNCGGALDLKAPDKTERVVCPNCAAMLDASQGQLRYLQTLEKQDVKMALPLGAIGNLPEGKMTAIGYLVRSVKIEGTRYFWEEYLLYEPKLAFRWLVCSDDHWSYVKPLPPGTVAVRSQYGQYGGRSFKLFQRATARVEHVVGEFYWKVTVGEKVEASDYVRPPEMLSREVSLPKDMGEINWSLGTYLTPKEVSKAFGVKSLPRPSGVAPHQPFRYKIVYVYWAFLAAVGFLIWALVAATTSHRTVFEKDYALRPMESADKTEVFFSEPFELKGWENIRVTARSNVDNSWLYVEGDLIQESTETGLVQPFAIPVEYYHGVEDGEAWSEGGQQAAAYLSALPAGKYLLRLEVQREQAQQPGSLAVRVEQGVPQWYYLFLMLGIISAIPLGVVAYHIWFEQRRWQDSYIGPIDADDDEVAVALPVTAVEEGNYRATKTQRRKKKRKT